MKEIGLEELKQLQLNILLSVHEFCMNNNIEYSLAAGTLIGAVRHKGYIPWDDDVDICMTRPNYDKFINSFNGHYNNLHVLAPEHNWNYYAPYANVCDNRTILRESLNGHNGVEVGVKIDVFPIDGCPVDPHKYYNLCKIVYWNNRKMFAQRTPFLNNPLGLLKVFVKKFLASYRTYSSFQKEIYNVVIQNDYESSELAGQMTFDPCAFRLPKEIFDTYIDVEFEGYKFRAVKEYDHFLRHRYGNYMKLPPLDQRVAHHGFTAYWKD